ncbi:MAG: hypothetical protein UZ17_ACD001001260 [Acidobacteria bacterium OLB17]|nr:MAG: hypothetical protein UZ17_ACD001001260 [Acidobacteria bacterium OLB17]MCZ2391661.1 zf-TFIIB domain-containing protein [Acidobacteriota bacterium]
MAIDLKDRGDALENEYFRKQEAELLAKMKAKLEAEKAAEGALKCPKCDGTLFEKDFENIVIDVCDKCSGVWFDAHEFVNVAMKEERSGWFGKLFE